MRHPSRTPPLSVLPPFSRARLPVARAAWSRRSAREKDHRDFVAPAGWRSYVLRIGDERSTARRDIAALRAARPLIVEVRASRALGKPNGEESECCRGAEKDCRTPAPEVFDVADDAVEVLPAQPVIDRFQAFGHAIGDLRGDTVALARA